MLLRCATQAAHVDALHSALRRLCMRCGAALLCTSAVPSEHGAPATADLLLFPSAPRHSPFFTRFCTPCLLAAGAPQRAELLSSVVRCWLFGEAMPAPAVAEAAEAQPLYVPFGSDTPEGLAAVAGDGGGGALDPAQLFAPQVRLRCVIT